MNKSPMQLFDPGVDADPGAESGDVVVTTADWKLDAACRGQLVLFFAPKAERPEARARREAKANRLCDECPVFDECRMTARTNREYGFWAGESEEDRHLLGFRVTAPIGVRARLADRDKRHDRSA
jgi:WhiB family redox-sensing transcriptional regulator